MRTLRNTVGLFLGLAIIGALASAIAALVARNHLESHGTEADDELDVVTIYSGRDLRSTATALRRASLLCWYGGGTLDLRGATLAPDGATITLRALFGGIRLVVPAEWRVERTLVAVFGGASDTRDQRLVAADGPLVRLHGWAAFGGIGVFSDAPDLDANGFQAAPDIARPSAAAAL